MGMTIDEYMAIKEQQACISKTIENLWNRAQQYEQLKADYEQRLKADMVAMLEELKLEFEEYEPKWAENEDQVIASNRTWDDFDDIIQQKIDALKEVKNAGRLAH